jgi:hypothetical protein
MRRITMNNHLYMRPGNGYYTHDRNINPNDTRIWGGWGWGFRPFGFGFGLPFFGFPFGPFGFGFGIPFFGGFPFFI